MHEPLLVNLLGHTAGVLVFGIFLVLLWRDRSGARLGARGLPVLAAALALIWNAASLLLLVLPGHPLQPATTFVAYASLSLLPAVLLHLSRPGRRLGLTAAGYVVSGLAIALHAIEPFANAAELHRRSLLLTAIVFGILTLIAGVTRPRFIGAMALFLFALSFAHFEAGGGSAQWPLELLLHHASIPLALIVLFEDFRFVLADAFLRFLANIALAAAFAWTGLWLLAHAGWPGLAAATEMQSAAAMVLGCAWLIGFALARSAVQRMLTRLLFRRPDLPAALESLRRVAARASNPTGFLDEAVDFIGAYAGAEGRLLTTVQAPVPVRPALALALDAEGVEVVIPIRAGADETKFVGLGRRRGGRRYLSEDLDALAELAASIDAHLESFREQDLRQLVSQAELRALHSQIHPHFLFNALNTLYGVIPREAAGARRMVLNLSDIFRYFLRADKTFIPLEDEIKIVREYLEIEALRLGSKLRTEITVAPGAGHWLIPVLSIQPLVENAVKHGIAPQPAGGTIRVEALLHGSALEIRVSDTGGGFGAASAGNLGSTGLGMENVRRRLRLCYGPDAELRVTSAVGATTVEFTVPASQPAAVAFK